MPEEKETTEVDVIPHESVVRQSGHEIAVGFSATFTAATTFFTGVIIAQYNSFDPSINIPTLMLIISTFGFLYATLVYSNISGMLVRGQYKKAANSGILGNVLSEYLGVYFIIFAIPLIINIISQDYFLRAATVVFDMVGLAIYHFSGFSIMERHYKKYHTLFMGIIIVLEVALIYFQFTNSTLFKICATFLIAFVFILAFFARKERL